MHSINTSASALRPSIPAPRDGALLPSSTSSAALESVSNRESAIKPSGSGECVSPAEHGAGKDGRQAEQPMEARISGAILSLMFLMKEKLGSGARDELRRFCSIPGYVMPKRYAEYAEQLGLTKAGKLHDATRSAMQDFFKKN